ncbi:hypothetical protein ACWGR3_28970 [Streptomyces albidoflavus]
MAPVHVDVVIAAAPEPQAADAAIEDPAPTVGAAGEAAPVKPKQTRGQREKEEDQ